MTYQTACERQETRNFWHQMLARRHQRRRLFSLQSAVPHATQHFSRVLTNSRVLLLLDIARGLVIYFYNMHVAQVITNVA